ncbi:MAG: LamG domain-containing protein, partial [Candidatus Dormibacteria bacterium]
LVGGAGALGAIAMATAATGAVGGLTATVTQSTGVSSGALVGQVTTAGTPCTSSGPAIVSDMQACGGSLLPPGVIPTAATPLSGTATLTNLGTSSALGAIRGGACGALGASDASGHGNPGLVYNGVTGAAGPFAGSGSLTFNGSNGWVETTAAQVDPSPVTEMAWFKTTSQGTILADTNVQSDSGPSEWDRQLWVDPSGHLVYGVYPGSIQEVVSTARYNTGQWYFVAASVGPAGEQLYVNGVLAAPVNSGATSAQSYTGWFHIGWGSEQSWPNSPITPYFGGAIADAAVIPAQLSPAQILTLFTNATSQAAFAGSVTALSPSPLAFWPLQDSGYVYPSPIPGGTSGSVSYPDSSGNGNTGSGLGGVITGMPGPFSGSPAAGFNGGSAYVETTTASNPQTLTESVWFRTTGGGVLMGLTNVQTSSPPSNYDRAMWLDASGQVVYGDWPGQTQEVVSPGSYNNGAWHLAVAEVGPAGEQLFVDGSLVASNSAYTVPQSYLGWWHLGYGNESQGWPNPPTSDYFSGSLADAAVFGTQLTAAQVADLWAASSQPAELALTLSLAPNSFWTLGQRSSGVCALVGVSAQLVSGATTDCLIPAGRSACPALAGAGDSTLAQHANASLSMASLGAGASVQIVFTLVQEGIVPGAYLGLHPTLPLQLSLARSSWSATLSYAAESLVL